MNENGKDNQIKDLIGSMTAEEWLRIRGAADLDELREALISIKARKAGKVTTFKKMAERIKRDAQAPGADQHKTLKDIIPYFYPAIEDIDGGTIEAIESEIEAAGGIAAVYDYIRSDAAEELEKRTREFYETIGQAIQEVIKAAGQLAAKMAAVNPNVDFNAIVEASQLPERLTPEIEALLPDFIAEHPEYNGVTAQDIVSYFIYGSGLPIPDNPFEPIITKALERIATGTDLTAEEIERIILQPVKQLLYPIDKPNSIIWNELAEAEPNGQLRLKIDTAKKGSGKEAYIMYALNFAELSNVQITKQLTAYDKRCYIAAAALYNGGNEFMTATQIYKMMGGRGTPNNTQLEKINESITKMGAAHVFISNEQEQGTLKGYPRFRYDAALLPFERVSKIINGTLSESVIHLLREPPLVTFARDRKQVTTIQRQLLETPVNKNDENLRIEDYLIERIGRIKAGSAKPKILYSTIFDRCKITGKQKQRAPAKIAKILAYYVSLQWIKGFKETADGITIEP